MKVSMSLWMDILKLKMDEEEGWKDGKQKWLESW